MNTNKRRDGIIPVVVNSFINPDLYIINITNKYNNTNSEYKC